jgi:hypothetical protein
MAAIKAPSPNIEAPEKLQTSKSQTTPPPVLNIEIWSFFGCWSLEFGAS